MFAFCFHWDCIIKPFLFSGCTCVCVPAGFPATAYGPVAAAAVAAARGSGRGARGRGGYLAYPQSTGPGKRSVHVLCGCCSLQLLLLCFSPQTQSPEPTCTQFRLTALYTHTVELVSKISYSIFIYIYGAYTL